MKFHVTILGILTGCLLLCWTSISYGQSESNLSASRELEVQKLQFKTQYCEMIPKDMNDVLHGNAMFDAFNTFNDSFSRLSPYLPATTRALVRMNPQDSTRSIAGLDPGQPGLNVSQATLSNLISSHLISSQIFSDNFSGGLAGWTKFSNAFTTSIFGTLTSPDGSPFGVIHTGFGQWASSGLLSKQVDLTSSQNLEFNFKYNFVSSEYPIWVGSQFNDFFKAEVHTPDGVTHVLAQETVNSSTFTPVSGLPTSVLDHSTGGQTGWKTVEKTVTTPSGTTVLHFHVQDVGDHIWDSAGLIDNVEVKKP